MKAALILSFCTSAAAFVPAARHSNILKLAQAFSDDGCKISAQDEQYVNNERRRALLLGTLALPVIWSSTAQVSFAAKLRPDDAYASLVKARQELNVAGETYLSKKDWDGLRTYLTEDATNMNNYEVNAGALLESKRLDAESKKDIGTIRRYGVGADVIIMWGGLKNEVDMNEEPSSAAVGKYLRRTAESLDEVLAICRSNGFP